MQNYDLTSFDVNARRVIEGPSNNLMAISPLKHKWARNIYDKMLENTWFRQEVDLSRDVKQYSELTDAERVMYDRALAFLSNLDGIQFNNLMNNISCHITSPEINMCISRQSWEEANHVDAYATLIEAIALDPWQVYTMFARDGMLGEKNEYIMQQSLILGEEYSAKNFVRAVVANILLEGIYFYSGFLAFYVLAKNGKMLGTADMIRFIQRDEVVHLNLFVLIFKTLQEERPELFDAELYDDIKVLFEGAVELESSWGRHIIEGGVLGLTDGIVGDYIKYRADVCLGMMGLNPMYGVKSPVAWVEKFSEINGNESNFFEAKVSAYSKGTLAW